MRSQQNQIRTPEVESHSSDCVVPSHTPLCSPQLFGMTEGAARKGVRGVAVTVAVVQVQGEASLQGQSRGRITIYCTAETLNRDLLSRKLRARGPNFLLHVRSGAG